MIFDDERKSEDLLVNWKELKASDFWEQMGKVGLFI